MSNKYMVFHIPPGINSNQLKEILIDWIEGIDKWIRIAKMKKGEEKREILAMLSTVWWIIEHQAIFDLSQRPSDNYLLFHCNSLDIKDNIQERFNDIICKIREAKFEHDNEEFWGDRDPHKTLICAMIFNIMFIIDLCSIERNCGKEEMR